MGANAEITLVLKSGALLHLPVDPNIDAADFRGYVESYGVDLLREGELFIDKDISGDWVVVPTENVEYFRARW